MQILEIEARKRISLSVLIAIDEVCKKNNIHYYLAYGTLIGAVRHKGFIPWDDDIDIWVNWDDYKKLNRILKRETNYEVLNFWTDTHFPLLFTKVSDPKTVVKSMNVSTDFHRGVAVDIFPLCGYSKTRVSKKEFKLIFFILKLFCENRRLSTRSIKGVRSVFLEKVLAVLRNIGLSEVFWMKRMEKLLTRNDDSLYLFSPFSPYANDVHLRDCFNKVNKISFEGFLFDCPAGYDQILANIYGDYMKIPPKEKQITNHDVVVYLID